MSSSKPMALGLANLDGFNCANRWLDASLDTTKRAGSRARWRAREYSAAKRKYARYLNADELLAEWELGFDETIASAVAYKRGKQFDRSEINRIARASSAASSLLSVLHMLPLKDQRNTLKACIGLAAGVVADLNALIEKGV